MEGVDQRTRGLWAGGAAAEFPVETTPNVANDVFDLYCAPKSALALCSDEAVSLRREVFVRESAETDDGVSTLPCGCSLAPRKRLCFAAVTSGTCELALLAFRERFCFETSRDTIM